MFVRHVGESLEELGRALPSACVATIGNFDGVHIGHAALVAKTVDRASSLGLSALGITFQPHPAEVFGRGPFSCLTVPEKRFSLLMDAGLDAILVLPFTPELASLSGAEFCESILNKGLGVRELVVGHDFKLGRDKAGVKELEAFGVNSHFSVQSMDAVLYQGLPVSSSRIREELRLSRLPDASAMLGRYHSVRGVVVHGLGRGGPLLGYPTANMDISDQVMPGPAIYATYASLVRPSVFELVRKNAVYFFSRNGSATSQPENFETAGMKQDGRLPGMTSFGRNPTFGGERLTLETYILDFDGDLYGKTLEITFCEAMRQERKFSNPDVLIGQLKLDEQHRREREERFPG